MALLDFLGRGLQNVFGPNIGNALGSIVMADSSPEQMVALQNAATLKRQTQSVDALKKWFGANAPDAGAGGPPVGALLPSQVDAFANQMAGAYGANAPRMNAAIPQINPMAAAAPAAGGMPGVTAAGGMPGLTAQGLPTPASYRAQAVSMLNALPSGGPMEMIAPILEQAMKSTFYAPGPVDLGEGQQLRNPYNLNQVLAENLKTPELKEVKGPGGLTQGYLDKSGALHTVGGSEPYGINNAPLVAADPSSPTGFSYTDRSGRVMVRGAPNPNAGAPLITRADTASPTGYSFYTHQGDKVMDGAPDPNPGLIPNREESLRKEADTKLAPINTAQQSLQRMASGLSLGSPAGDKAALYAFVNLANPGAAAAKEGSALDEASVSALGDTFRKAWQRYSTGQLLLPEQRNELSQVGRSLFRTQVNNYRGIQNQYRDLATGAKVNPEHVAPDPIWLPTPPAIKGLRDAPTDANKSFFDQKYYDGAADDVLKRGGQ